MHINKKFLYLAISISSLLIAFQSFTGANVPGNFFFGPRWYQALIASIIIFGYSTSMLFKQKRSDSSAPSNSRKYSTNKKLLYLAISISSLLIAFQSFTGANVPGNFFFGPRWYQALIASIIIFGYSTSMLFKMKWSDSSAPSSNQKYSLIVAAGFALMLGAIPAGFMFGLAVGGCCGAPGNGFALLAVPLMIGMFVGGIVAIIYGIKKNRQLSKGSVSTKK